MMSLLDQGKTSAETANILATTPGLFAYNRATVRGYHRDWKNGKLPDVKVLTDDELTSALTTPSDIERHGTSPTDDDTHRKTAQDTDIHRTTPYDDDAELLRRVKRMIATIKPIERPAVKLAKGEKRDFQTAMLSVRLPKKLVDDLEALGGRKTDHTEKALTLYLRALATED